MIKHITADVKTSTANKLFDAQIQQMYLDNSLRGGVPVLLGDVDDQSHALSVDEDKRIKAYHLFSRIHGDLERGTSVIVFALECLKKSHLSLIYSLPRLQ